MKKLLAAISMVAFAAFGAFAETIVLDEIVNNITVPNGATLTGTLSANYKVTIAAGAHITLEDAQITGGHRHDLTWAGLTCEGDATIELKGSNAIRGFQENYPGIFVPNGFELTICGTGSLTADSTRLGAGIGGIYNGAPCGDITIESGTVNAYGGKYSAGIGGGFGSSCGNIKVTGGTVNAYGGQYAPGIGSGHHGSCGDITISGGTVNATGGASAPGIGTGYQKASCDDITITQIDGSPLVVAKSGEGAYDYIGKGYSNCSCGDIVIDPDLSVTVNPGARTKTVSVWNHDLAELQNDILVKDGATIRGTLEDDVQITIADGATVTLDNVTIAREGVGEDDDLLFAGITCEGSARIILVGENVVRGFNKNYPGIYVPRDCTLTIEGDGSLAASSNGAAAGIGAGYGMRCGNIDIEGGSITATGGYLAAGIGGAQVADCGTITIGSGIAQVTATSGGTDTYKADPIGRGYANSSSSAAVTVNYRLADKTEGNTRTIRKRVKDSATTADGCTFEYGIGFDDIMVTGGSPAPSGVLKIPAYFGHYPVKSIMPYAFHNNADIALVVIPEGVEAIGHWAFYGCSKLDTVILPSTVQEIGTKAFFIKDSYLTFLVARKDAERVGNLLIDSDHKTASFEVVDELSEKIGGITWYYLFNSDYETVTIARESAPNTYMSAADPAPTGDVTLPSAYYRFRATGIGPFALSWKTGITSVVVPDSVTVVGTGAFQGCSSLSDVNLGANIADIAPYAFADCANPLTFHVAAGDGERVRALLVASGLDVEDFTIDDPGASTPPDTTTIHTWTSPKGVTWSYRLVGDGNGGYGAEVCSGIVDTPAVSVPDGETLSGRISIPETLGGYTVTRIGDFAFYQCGGITRVVIPDTVTGFGMYAFAHCLDLVKADIPAAVTEIGEAAFMRTALTSATIPDGVPEIDSMAFMGCASLEEITIGGNTAIFPQAFENTALSTVYVPEGCTDRVRANFIPEMNPGVSADDLTFIEPVRHAIESGSTWSYRLVNGEAELYVEEGEGGWAIIDPAPGISIDIPSELDGHPVTRIGEYAFFGCRSLQSVTSIPDTVVRIGEYAFKNCAQLATVNIPASVTEIGEDAFYGTALNEVWIKAGMLARVKEMLAESGLYANTIDALHFIIFDGEEEVDGYTLHYEVQYDYGIEDYVAIITQVDSPQGDGGALAIPSEVDAVDGGFVVRKIGEEAFAYSNITSVSIPEGVTEIGPSAFAGCEDLVDVTLPSTIEIIGGDAFMDCEHLTKIKVPSGTATDITVILEEAGLDLTGGVSVEEYASSDPYSEWAELNGITGAWDEKGADGIANVFRYIFEGTDFSTTPLIDIAFDGENVVIKTPMVMHSDGFKIVVKSSGNVGGTGEVMDAMLDATGNTQIPRPESASARFYWLIVEKE